MAVAERDAFDLALVAIALVLVVGPAVGASNPAAVVGRAVSAVTSLGPLTYLFLLGVAGVLFAAYAVLYLPNTQ
ncbi:hypothetical protein [Halosimplex halophilum]|uniref:hypothetical protein n=1 Tax=Halosimplex halophilum TaxID=2559572 RepID=UPI00107FAB63|nr:hypothetical protein [Halosimplex halophilum]